MNSIKSIEKIWDELPPNLQEEVKDFAEFLLNQYRTTSKTLQLQWAGALMSEKKISTQDLQRKILESWGD